MKTVKTMQKALAIFLSVMIVISCCITAIATAPTYTTASDLAVATNWVASDGITPAQNGSAVRFEGWNTVFTRGFTALVLKPNTEYVVTAGFATSGDKLYDNENGIIVVPASDYTKETAVATTWSTTATKNIGTAPYTHNNLTTGTLTVTFTTGSATDYTLGFQVKGDTANGDSSATSTIDLSNFVITENGPAAPTYTTATDLAVATNWVASDGITPAQNGSAVRFEGWNTVFTRGFTALVLKPNTEYVVTAGFATSGDKLYDNENGIIVVPASDYTKETAVATTWSTTAAKNIGTGPYTHNNLTTGTLTVTFTTGSATDYTLGFQVKGDTANGDSSATSTIDLSNFVITENGPAAPTYTTATDLAVATNWVASDGITPAQNGSAVRFEAWNTVFTRGFTSLVLKPNTEYVVTASFATSGDKLYDNENGIIVVPASDYTKETAVATTWSTAATKNIGTGPYTHNNLTTGTLTVTFTTGSATDYTLGFQVKGDTANGDSSATSTIDLSNFAITEKPPTPTITTSADLAKAGNWFTIDGDMASITQKDASSIDFTRWYTVWKPYYTSLYLEPNTKYIITADYTVKSTTEQEIVEGDYGVAVVPAASCSEEDLKTKDWSQSAYTANIADASGYTHKGTVKSGETKTMTAIFTTGAEQEYFFGFQLKGGVGTKTATGISVTNFKIEKYVAPDFAATEWTFYAHNTDFASTPLTEQSVVSSTDKDVSGDGKSLKFSAANAVITTPFKVAKDTTYTLVYKYYADLVVKNWPAKGLGTIMTDTAISTGSAEVKFETGHMSGNLSGISPNGNFTTTGGNVDTAVNSTTGQRTNKALDQMAGKWHTVALQFNSADFEQLYLIIRMAWGSPTMYLDDIQLIEGTPDLEGDFKSTNWTVYEQGDTAPGNTFGGKIQDSGSVKSTLTMDIDGDGLALEVNASNNVPTVPFTVPKTNTDYTLSFQYYSSGGVKNFLNTNFIIKEAFISNGTTKFDFGSVEGNLTYSGFNQSFTTENGDADTKVVSNTENLTSLGSDMKNNWHTIKLRFNSGDYTDLYLGMCLGWGVDTMYIDNISLSEYRDPQKAASWTAYDGNAVDLSAAPSTTLTIGESSDEANIKHDPVSIQLNTAGGHAAVPIEVEKNTAYYLYYYYKSDSANAVSASTVLAPGGAFASPLGTADLGKGTAGAWSKALIEFNSGNNSVVYLNVDVKNGAYPVYFNGLKLLEDVDANTAMESASHWLCYEDGINGNLAPNWAVVSDSYNPNYDHDGDGHSVKIAAPNCYATVPLRHLQQDTWYRLTYWYYSPTQITDSGRDLVLDNTRVSKEDADFDFGPSEGALVGQNFITNFTTKNGDLTTAISYIGGGTGEATGTQKYAGVWHRVEMFFNSYDNETLYLSAKPAALRAGMIMTVYIDDCKLEVAQPYLLTGETEETNLYCEQMYNGLPNASFESATTEKDWGAPLPTGMEIVSGENLPHGTKYLNVNGKHVYELRLEGMALYTLAASLRGTGLVGITSDHEGLNFLLNEAGDQKSALTVNGATEWQRKAVTFRASASGLLYLVFDAEESLDVDYIQLFEKEFGRQKDLDNFIPIEDFDFDNIDPSIIVLNGGVDEDYVPPVLGGEPSPETGESAAAITLAVALFISAIAALFVTKQPKGDEAQ